jgi:hypothetical protein
MRSQTPEEKIGTTSELSKYRWLHARIESGTTWGDSFGTESNGYLPYIGYACV